MAEINQQKLDVLLQMIDRRVNSPLTSSCGRLFDAVAAIAGVRNAVTYEAQAAIELEMAMDDVAQGTRQDVAAPPEPAESNHSYPFALIPRDSGLVIGTRPLFEALVEDILAKRPLAEISRRFHNGLIAVFLQIATQLRRRTSLNRVCLSGGTFNNLYLTQNLSQALSTGGFEVFTQNEVPAGDGGLSLGQAMIACSAAR
jgi:hydrogenase maturation protein HypF